VGGLEGEMATRGFPQMLGGFTKAPFDTVGDTLRGTKGIMMDMYRQPAKLLKAMEALTPLMIKMGVGAAQVTGKPIIFMPLHKGADGFLSDEQFKKFYWPTLKEVMMGLIDAGCVPFPAAEGGYNSRLSVIKDLPRGKTAWMFDNTDMVKAKKIVGDTLCILGNMPSSMLSLGTPQEVSDYAKKLIDAVGKGGGFIMGNGSFFDQAKAENIKAMVEVTKEHGVYR
jgi:uroporphyrinogen-III decarboxylase